tara:strand:- start:66 stop:545 length:480 start_codon:yes stop_codon:yes gene_type:complete
MNFAKVDYTEDYIKFCTEAGLPIGKLPKSKKDMGLDEQLLMQDKAPHLYQNLCNPDPSELPADVAQRYRKGIQWVSDVQILEDAGFTGTAANMKKAIDEAKQTMIEKDLAEMAAKNDQVAAYNRDRPKGLAFAEQLSPEAVARNRAAYGLTGKASWENS